MRNIKLTLEYDGTGFSGWQRLRGRPSVQAEVERAVHAVTRERVTVIGAGRTDAGVHAIGQVVNFDPPDSREGYVHRVGRTARAGQEGTGVTFVLPDQRGDVGRIARQLHLHQEFEREGLQIDPPRLVYASRRGRRSQLSGRRNRRF